MKPGGGGGEGGNKAIVPFHTPSPPLSHLPTVPPEPAADVSHDEISPFTPLAREKRIGLLRAYPTYARLGLSFTDWNGNWKCFVALFPVSLLPAFFFAGSKLFYYVQKKARSGD